MVGKFDGEKYAKYVRFENILYYTTYKINELKTLNVLIADHAQTGKSSLISSIVEKIPDILDFKITHGSIENLKIIQFRLKKSDLL